MMALTLIRGEEPFHTVITATLANEVVCDFRIVQHSPFEPDPTEIASGHVKWDGCVNLDVGSECMWHGCDVDDIGDLADLLRAAYWLCAVELGAAWKGGDPPDEEDDDE